MIRRSGGNNNIFVLVILIGLLAVFGIYCVWGKSSEKSENHSESSKPTKPIKDSMEIIEQADSNILEEYNDGPPKETTELLDPGEDDFGMDDGMVSYL